jgi:hypothetical protein
VSQLAVSRHRRGAHRAPEATRERHAGCTL